MKEWINNRYHGVVFGRTRIGEFLNALYSIRLFLRYSFKGSYLNEQENSRSFLIKQYHIIEKGLAMPAPRENFGIPKIKTLLAKLKNHEGKYGADSEISEPIRNCLNEYLEANPNLEQKDKDLYRDIMQLCANMPSTSIDGGTKHYDIENLKASINLDFETFLQTRSSVRNFKQQKVEISDIEKAISLARNAPSVCNRQNWRVHYYDDDAVKQKLLGLQHGNNGFNESIQGLFVVTTDIRGFTRMEQNQVFVDGGLFSMNLVLSLHSLGIGSCCLNTCFPYTRENAVKKAGDIPKNERLIMMIGLGYWKDDFKVAYSKKKEITELLTIH